MRADSRLPLVLASASPRRQLLLRKAGVPFEAIPAQVDERPRRGEPARVLARRLAREKALAVARHLGPVPGRHVLGADTIVVLGDSVLGKPRDSNEAVAMLRRLVGRTHRVLTAVALATSDGLELRERMVESSVRMRAAPDEELRAYVASGEPLDKAGAYAIQGRGGRFVEAVDGSRSNVIGLPIDETLELLREAGGPWARAV
jgi:septum formation protein